MADCPHGGFTTMCKYCDAETVERYTNQCDGCRRGLTLGTNGYHYDFDGSGALPVMYCTKDRYQSPNDILDDGK